MGLGKESNGEQPLLGKRPQVQAVPVAIAGLEDSSTRNWQGKLYACFGDCDNTGLGAAALTHTAPCLAFGLNGKRAFGKSLLFGAFAFASFFMLWYFAAVSMNGVVLGACGPPPPPLELEPEPSFAQLPEIHNRRLLHKHHHDHDEHHMEWELKRLEDKAGWLVGAVDGEGHEGKDHKDHPHSPPPKCQEALRTVLVLHGIMSLLFVSGVFYAARHRTAIRERFGIPGSRVKDFFAWCCCGPCALCQETRTLWHNNVHEGVWHGPTMFTMAAVDPLEAPTQLPQPAEAV